MEYVIVICALYCLVVHAMGNCDHTKCMTTLGKGSAKDPKELCPAMSKGIECLETIMETCPLIYDQRSEIEPPIKRARKNINLHCSAPGPISGKTLLLFLPLLIKILRII